MLVQESAHEDANIIFGAVIDDEVPEGELRVTVIATGLEGEGGRKRAEPAHTDPISQPLEIHHVATVTDLPATGLERVTSFEQIVPLEKPLSKEGEFTSPYEEELDTPAFLRRAQD
jgi:cell division protein FtsZ